MNKIKIYYYKANNGIYLNKFWNSSDDQILINGKSPTKTFSNKWYFLKEEDVIKKITCLEKGWDILIGVELVDSSFECERMPRYLTSEDVGLKYSDLDEDYIFTEEPYINLRSLYRIKYDKKPDEWVEQEFEAIYKGTLNIEQPDNIPNMIVKVDKHVNHPYAGDKEINIDNIANFYELEKMLIPEFALYQRPCYLTSKQTYDIVRHYVRENINPKEARITSDYDFCFEVKKVIHIKPYSTQYEKKKTNGKSYSPPRIITNTISEKLEKVFEMTSIENKYKGYTPIKEFRGDNLEDLINNIKLFLDELMYHINIPVKECECCCGCGHIFHKYKHKSE